MKAVATWSPQSRHVGFERFQVFSAQGTEVHSYIETDSLATNEPIRPSVHIDRLMFCLFLATSRGETGFLKSSEACWKLLSDFLNRHGFEIGTKSWVEVMFGANTLKEIFVDTRDRKHKKQRWLIVDEAKLDIASSNVLILDKATRNALSEEEHLLAFQKVLTKDLSDDFKRERNEFLDTGYILKLASELQIAGLNLKYKMVLGKTVWLSQLASHRELLRFKFHNDDCIVSRFESFLNAFDPRNPEQGNVLPESIESTWKELAAFHRYFRTSNFRNVLSKSGIKMEAFDGIVDELIEIFAKTETLKKSAARTLLADARIVIDELLSQFNESIASGSKTLEQFVSKELSDFTPNRVPQM